jgi:hypothetical protein
MADKLVMEEISPLDAKRKPVMAYLSQGLDRYFLCKILGIGQSNQFEWCQTQK